MNRAAILALLIPITAFAAGTTWVTGSAKFSEEKISKEYVDQSYLNSSPLRNKIIELAGSDH